MSTETTTTTTTTDGVVTTSTTTVTQASASAGAEASGLLPIEQSDTSIYEVREYYCDTALFEAGERAGPRNAETAYGKWVTSFGEIGGRLFDVVCVFWKMVEVPETRISGPGHATKGLMAENNFDKAHPNTSVVVHWIARWDSMEHAALGWAQAMKSEKFGELLGQHPYIKNFVRMESRWMKAVSPVTRVFEPTKIYEVRRYTFDEWTAESRAAYCDWARLTTIPGVNVVQFYVAEAQPVTTTVSGLQLLGGEAYNVDGVTPPHVSWTCVWDSVEQAAETWNKLFSDPKSVAAPSPH